MDWTTETKIVEAFRLNPLQKMGIARLGLETLSDLLSHFPNRYEQPGQAKNIADLAVGENAVVGGKVLSAETKKSFRRRMPMSEAVIEDQTGKLKIVWFHQAYMAKKIPEGHFGEFRGRIAERNGELYMTNPEVREVGFWQAQKNSLFSGEENGNTSFLIPIYPETRGLSSGWFYYHIQQILKAGLHLKERDPLPAEILQKYHLPALSTALVWAHTPRKAADHESAQKRFAFEEIFYIQLRRLKDKNAYQSLPAYHIKTHKKDLDSFVSRFPFEMTKAQKKAIDQILKDLAGDKPMTRLLEGDVGSGKTAVAATTAFAAVSAGFEVAYMAPTEILARQHFESFIQYFSHLGIQVGLLTGKGCRKFPSKINPHTHTDISRSQLLKWVAGGQIPILVGTHALIQKTVKFKKLAYTIIDEQHRFGVMQRAKLVRKNGNGLAVPHLLSMTATPIPRTLALTVYGDLDLTLIDELPAGRKPVITEIITPDKRNEVYEKIREELAAGRQAYIICPRIDEPDPDKKMALYAKSARAEKMRLERNIFPDFEIGLMHSKMKPAEKEKAMERFKKGEIDILVSTSVVEVGVNVPNATVIVIEGAERFGLAQLHQLRGRVFRSSHQAYCFLLTETEAAKSLQRLRALKTAKNGFELAEQDLALRGAGLLSGEKQWGLSDIGMEAIKNIKMVEAARIEAQELLKNDPELSRHPLINDKVSHHKAEIHFE